MVYKTNLLITLTLVYNLLHWEHGWAFFILTFMICTVLAYFRVSHFTEGNQKDKETDFIYYTGLLLGLSVIFTEYL